MKHLAAPPVRILTGMRNRREDTSKEDQRSRPISTDQLKAEARQQSGPLVVADAQLNRLEQLSRQNIRAVKRAPDPLLGEAEGLLEERKGTELPAHRGRLARGRGADVASAAGVRLFGALKIR